jgi:hypothetical protein
MDGSRSNPFTSSPEVSLIVGLVGPRGPKPIGGGIEQRLGHRIVLYGLEEPEEPVSVGVLAQVHPALDGGNAPHDAPGGVLGEEKLRRAVLEERILLRVEHFRLVHPQRRDEAAVALIVPVDEVDEPLAVAGGSDGTDGHGRARRGRSDIGHESAGCKAVKLR